MILSSVTTLPFRLCQLQLSVFFYSFIFVSFSFVVGCSASSFVRVDCLFLVPLFVSTGQLQSAEVVFNPL